MAAPQFKAVLITTQMRSESGLTFRSKHVERAVAANYEQGIRGEYGQTGLTPIVLAAKAYLSA